MARTKKSSWGFDIRDLDPHTRPQDDFYHYVNRRWIEKNPIPPHESRWGSFLKLRFDVEKNLHKIVREIAAKKNLPDGSPERIIRDFFLSGMNRAQRNALGITPLGALRKEIRAAHTPEKLTRVIAKLHTIGVSVLWAPFVDQDAKNSTRYIFSLAQSGLGMPDRDYYLKKDTESRRVRDAYEKHVEALFRLMGRKRDEAAKETRVLLSLENKLARASMRKEDTRDVEKIYHKKTSADLKKLAPHIPWDIYFKNIYAPIPENLIVMQPDFLAAVDALLAHVSPTDWHTYLEWHLVNDYASALSSSFVRQSFSFYGKVLTGLEKMRPLWRRVLAEVNTLLGEILGQIYVKRYFSPEAKKKMLELVEDLFIAYENRIKNLEWMSPQTKRKAVQKLKAMTRKIGYPDKWKSYRGLVIKENEYAGNVMRATLFNHKREMKKLLRKSVDYTEWFMFPQTVNAYCNFGMNEIVFPAAILQPPFFGEDFDDAVNYGAIGSVIGHEITHGFDDQGSKFDEKGNLKNWWTPEDRRRFEKRAAVLKKQFDAYTVADGVKVNGQLTLGENVADLGGVSIAFDAYQRHLEKHRKENRDGFTPEQRFFLAFAVFEREKARPEAQKTHALTDPHAPGIFRINGPLSNLPEFYDAFGVKKGDKLHRAPHSRAKIW